MKKLEEIERKNRLLNFFQKILESAEELEFNHLVFKKYIEYEGATNLMNYLNKNGYKVKTNTYIGQRNYNTVDIREFILNPKNHQGVTSELVEVATYIADNNSWSSWEQKLLNGIEKVYLKQLSELSQ